MRRCAIMRNIKRMAVLLLAMAALLCAAVGGTTALSLIHI